MGTRRPRTANRDGRPAGAGDRLGCRRRRLHPRRAGPPLGGRARGRRSRRAASGHRGRPSGIPRFVRRRRGTMGGAGSPSRSRDRDAWSAPRAGNHPHHRRRQFRFVGRSWLPLPEAGYLPWPDIGRDGLRPPGCARRSGRAPRPAGRRARRGRRLRNDDGRARNGRSGAPAGDRAGIRQSPLRNDPRAPGRTRSRPGNRHRAGRHRFRRGCRGSGGGRLPGRAG